MQVFVDSPMADKVTAITARHPLPYGAAAILVAAQDAAWGPIQHKGRLHDRASYRYYWELLQRARHTGMELPDEARQRFFAH